MPAPVEPTKCPVVVIGAGVSGLTSVKACLEENVHVICYETTDNVGGLWRYKESTEDGVASVMKSTIINTSKEMTAFSDFPPPDNFPNFMHNRQVVEYLEDYSRHFNLRPHIKLRHRVIKVREHEHFQQNGHWMVTVRNKETAEESEVEASAVLVCTGHHAYPYTPSIEGLKSDFKGTVVHSRDYKLPKAYEDRKVLVVGIGNSGGDIAVELSHTAKKVYLVSRRGSWVLPRLGDHGEPLDIQFGRRYIIEIINRMPFWLKNIHAEFKLNSRYDHAMYNLQPKHRFYSQHPMVNDELPGKLLSGAIVLKGPIDHLHDNSVVFQGEPHMRYDIDDVIMATGYTFKFPFLEENVAGVKENHVSLYKYVFPPRSAHSTLAFIGLVQPFGALPPICEMQARWVVQVLLGHRVLPSADQMEKDIAMTAERHRQRYVDSRRHTVEVDSLPYLDEIARMIGVKPCLTTLLTTDVKLLHACVFGPCVPYQYRLHGPHPWKEARDVIMHTPRRVAQPFKTRFPLNQMPAADYRSEINKIFYGIIALVASFFLWFFSIF